MDIQLETLSEVLSAFFPPSSKYYLLSPVVDCTRGPFHFVKAL